MATVQQDSYTDLLRCPVCRSDLEIQCDQCTCTNIGCSQVFPQTQGIPILLNESNSVFSRDTFLSRQTTFFKPRGRLRALVSRCLPSEDCNVAAQRVLGDLRDRLVAEYERPQVLVLGGGILGDGMDVLAADSRIELIETDVSLEERTQLICDAHDLPFCDRAFHAVIVQATLEHVVDPRQCVEEIHRVLIPNGFVYADTPFIQQVHGREYDFTRFTRLGHRRLFRDFEEIDSGISVGPGSALAWSARYFMLSFCHAAATRRVVSGLARVMFGWLKYFDNYLSRQPAALDASAAYYFLGRKSESTLSDRDLLAQYKGGF